jgi:hypothetical protein
MRSRKRRRFAPGGFTMRTPVLPLVLFIAAAFATAYQPPPGFDDDGPEPTTLKGGRPGGPQPGMKGGPGGEPGGTTEATRMGKLKQLSFDRRPSSILKAWAPQPKGDELPGVKSPLDLEVESFHKSVIRGEWAKVKTYLASLPDEEAIAAYQQMLQSLRQTPSPLAGALPPGAMIQPGVQQFMERNSFTVDDVIGLAAAAPSGTNAKEFGPRSAAIGVSPLIAHAPRGLSKDQFNSMAGMLREAINAGTLPEVVVARLKLEIAKPADQAVFTKRQAAKLMTNCGHPELAGDFLPTAEEAQKTGDLEALNLLSRHFLAKHAQETEAGNQEKAWNAVQTVLSVPGGSREELEEALLRAVDLAPKLKEKLGQQWLDESFTKNPERGMQILATAGALVSEGLVSRAQSPDERLNALKLLKTAVDALLKASPERAKEWKSTLSLLAVIWLREAEFSRQHDTSSNTRMRRDRYGNPYFFMDDDGPMMRHQMMRQDMPQPIAVAEIIKTGPSKEWVQAVDESLRPKVAATAARLHLKTSDEDKAFPMIEEMAATQPAEARDLVREFLRVWTRNHDMNQTRNEFRSIFYYGFEQRSEGIPLTRAKQERNLAELSAWTVRIRKLPGTTEADEELLIRAFTACHSSAEVYRTEAIESVFGPLGSIKPRTLAGLAHQMRENLAGLWKNPNTQAAQKTNRKQKDIESEVRRGYLVAGGVIDDGLKKFPNSWALVAAKAGLIHDEANFDQELARSADFAGKRLRAFALYQKAADLYAIDVKGLPESEHTTSLYEQWFAASLGAVDLGAITEEKLPDWKQPPLIRKALLALPGDLADKHMGKFANSLFVKMTGAKPHVKFNYLKAGFDIVGDHKHAVEAKKLFDYYKDLVQEIKLDVVVDGSTRVGHTEPFGIFVNIRHTREIERESGGFGRYLQNQSGYRFYYNYGRPTTDYKDRFEVAARAALKEQYEVISVTFQDEKVNSRAASEFGWRYTPYAYVLLKPRGPQVDKIPPLRLDLDFLDTTGYMILPIESPIVPVDSKASEPRPLEKLSVTQTLDERQADKGILILEIKASGIGLVPDLKDLCTIDPEGFEIEKIDDQGLAVKKFDEDADSNCIVSERTWAVKLKAKEGLSELPKTFRFAPVSVPTKEVIFQRYVDADLVAVEQTVPLEQTYGKKSNRIWWVIGALAFVCLVLVGVCVVLATRGGKQTTAGLALPENLDPFIAATLLKEIRERPELTVVQRAELDQDLAEVEQYYFSADRNGTPTPDLRRIVSKWAAAAPSWKPAVAPVPA